MTNKFLQKYRIPTARAIWWDYSNEGLYFITICTKDRIHYFGSIQNGEIQLTELGVIAFTNWEQIPLQFEFVELHSFIIMPNHIHGIIEIKSEPVETSIHGVSNNIIKCGITGEKNAMNYNTISKIVRWFKGKTTFEIHTINSNFEWQSRFHDHIIRNDDEYSRIAEYIENNPLKWNDDRYFL